MFLVGMAYYTKEDIKRTTFNKYETIKQHVVGLNDFFEVLSIDIFRTRANHKEFVNRVTSELLKVEIDVAMLY